MANCKDSGPPQDHRRYGASSSQAMRRLAIEEDDIIKLPECDLKEAAERFKLTLIGRVFQLKSRSIDALINLLPKPRIGTSKAGFAVRTLGMDGSNLILTRRKTFKQC